MKTINNTTKYLILGAFFALIILPLTLFAQGNGGGAQVGASQDRDQVRLQDQDGDCIVGEECDGPDRDRDRVQDRDRIQDPTLSDGDGPDRERLQDRDRDQDGDCIVGEECDGPDQDRDRDRDRDRLQIHTSDELRTAIQEQQRLMLNASEEVGESVRNIHRNQNQVRVAASAFSSTSGLFGPMGPAVERIAKDFDTSVQATIRAEEQLQNRGGFARFLFGSDDDTVKDLGAHVAQNQLRTQELNQLMEAWDGEVEVKTMLQEQIRNMEQEQVRLQQLADEAQGQRGVFGFLFGWL